MSSTEWMTASHVTRSATGSRSASVSGVTRGILEPRVRERLDHAAIELRVGRVVDDRAGVLALEVDRVDAAELPELGEDLVGPVRSSVELEAQRGVEVEEGAEPIGRGRVAQAPGSDERDGLRLAPDGVAERSIRLSEREIEGGALEGPAAVVGVRVPLGVFLEQRQRVEVA